MNVSTFLSVLVGVSGTLVAIIGGIIFCRDRMTFINTEYTIRRELHRCNGEVERLRNQVQYTNAYAYIIDHIQLFLQEAHEEEGGGTPHGVEIDDQNEYELTAAQLSEYWIRAKEIYRACRAVARDYGNGPNPGQIPFILTYEYRDDPFAAGFCEMVYPRLRRHPGGDVQNGNGGNTEVTYELPENAFTNFDGANIAGMTDNTNEELHTMQAETAVWQDREDRITDRWPIRRVYTVFVVFLASCVVAPLPFLVYVLEKECFEHGLAVEIPFLCVFAVMTVLSVVFLSLLFRWEREVLNIDYEIVNGEQGHDGENHPAAAQGA